jgi:hypothetical protein
VKPEPAPASVAPEAEITQGKRILFPGNHAEDSERVIGFPTSYLSLLRDAFA